MQCVDVGAERLTIRWYLHENGVAGQLSQKLNKRVLCDTNELTHFFLSKAMIFLFITMVSTVAIKVMNTALILRQLQR